MQVHSSDVPETANITKCLAVACAISFTGVGALVLLLALADPTKLNWWHWWNVTLDTESELGQPIITNVRSWAEQGWAAWGLGPSCVGPSSWPGRWPAVDCAPSGAALEW